MNNRVQAHVKSTGRMKKSITDDPLRIIVRTASNKHAAQILFFYTMDVSRLEDCIIITYESCEQVASICRMLVEENIDILEIYTEN